MAFSECTERYDLPRSEHESVIDDGDLGIAAHRDRVHVHSLHARSPSSYLRAHELYLRISFLHHSDVRGCASDIHHDEILVSGDYFAAHGACCRSGEDGLNRIHLRLFYCHDRTVSLVNHDRCGYALLLERSDDIIEERTHNRDELAVEYRSLCTQTYPKF